jgi:hypothetical protein
MNMEKHWEALHWWAWVTRVITRDMIEHSAPIYIQPMIFNRVSNSLYNTALLFSWLIRSPLELLLAAPLVPPSLVPLSQRLLRHPLSLQSGTLHLTA